MDFENQTPKDEHCWICGQRFSNLDDLNRHLRRNWDNCVCCKCGNEFPFGQGCQHPLHQPNAPQPSCDEDIQSRTGNFSPYEHAEKSTKRMPYDGRNSSGKCFTPAYNLEGRSQALPVQNEMAAGCGIPQFLPESNQWKSYEENDPDFCAPCSSTFSDLNSMSLKRNRHEARKTKEASKSSPVTFSCIFCDEVFNSQRELEKHHHREKEKFVCCLCGEKLSVPDMVQHSETHRNENQFSSALHGESLSNESYLKRRKSSHTGKKPYLCPACLRRYASETYLKKHILSCKGSKPHSCKDCGKSFKRKNVLVEHSRIHTGERPHICKTCNLSFRDSP